jgi:hypothetical protein
LASLDSETWNAKTACNRKRGQPWLPLEAVKIADPKGLFDFVLCLVGDKNLLTKKPGKDKGKLVSLQRKLCSFV